MSARLFKNVRRAPTSEDLRKRRASFYRPAFKEESDAMLQVNDDTPEDDGDERLRDLVDVFRDGRDE